MRLTAGGFEIRRVRSAVGTELVIQPGGRALAETGVRGHGPVATGKPIECVDVCVALAGGEGGHVLR